MKQHEHKKEDETKIKINITNLKCSKEKKNKPAAILRRKDSKQNLRDISKKKRRNFRFCLVL